MDKIIKIFLLFMVLFLSGCLNNGSTPDISGEAQLDLDSFAECITESGAKMYGAYWCGHCNNQKDMFGDSWDYINYIECSLPNQGGQTQYCAEQEIEGYPTWEFNDGTRLSGALPLEELASKTNCQL